MSFPVHFDLFEYFRGATRAYGLFETPFGRCRRQLLIDLSGRVEGDTLILDEAFVYDDGERQQRTWRIQRISHSRYRGTAADLSKPALGNVVANRLHWRYQLNLPVGQRSVRVDFNDQMFLMADDVLINRARLSKWGIPIGSVTLAFNRLDRSTSP
ncbi:DUF3833 domain-containing protein [Marinobacterium sp. D7]|uniref:DUF3833 family protein n=1 Tax=Marinobacterium ramblicola TaxID=2849041 RepID=UPI001C2DE5F9|nr:DUF3833 family protein [Marinobacterium ramblicola]MBV1788167.1 DUF3833 domain-containing protein [Marinobacterium ramblicola]